MKAPIKLEVILSLVSLLLWSRVSCLAQDECNRTITSTSRVTSWDLGPHHAGSELFCTIAIRSPGGGHGHAHGRGHGVVRIEFDRLKVGSMEGGKCTGGYMSILDGTEKTNHEFGRFCGESEQRHAYFAEYPNVDIVISVEYFDDLTEFDFEVAWVKKANLAERFGPRPALFPHIRGNLVSRTFCERVFQECSRLQTCYVQSPGYPGVYPRNLNCRYYLSTKQPFIKLYVNSLRPVYFDVAGQDCDSIVSCPFYEIGERNCTRDSVRVYDGVDEYSTLIGTFCGIGEFPSSIIGTGKELFLEFVTSEEGPFLGNGFDLRVGHLPGNIRPYNDQSGSCRKTYRSEDLERGSEGLFLSLEHWYPPGTNCTFEILGRPSEVVRLYFPSFKVNAISNPLKPDVPGGCRESLSLYDSHWTDGKKIIKTFCDEFSRPLEKFDFVSTGNSLVVNFISTTGSYSGSSLQFWAQFDFFDATVDGMRVEGTLCDEIFSGEAFEGEESTFRSPRNTLLFKNTHRPIKCEYNIVGDGQKYDRILLDIHSIFLKPPRVAPLKSCPSCLDDPSQDHIEIRDPYSQNELPNRCISNCSSHSTGLQFVSARSEISLLLHINNETSLLNYFKCQAPLFRASYRFIHPPVCGPASHHLRNQIQFPSFGSPQPPARTNAMTTSDAAATAAAAAAAAQEEEEVITCVWDVSVDTEKDLRFHFANFTFGCDGVSLAIKSSTNLKNSLFDDCQRIARGGKVPIFFAKDMDSFTYSRLQIHFSSKQSSAGRFLLQWSQSN